jgi:hypothetical protein
MARRKAKRREARSGLPPVLERALMRRYGRTAAGRMRAAGALRALGVLLRRHPKAAAEALGAGVLRAGRVGVADLAARLSKRAPRPARQPRPTRAELRRLRRVLDVQG